MEEKRILLHWLREQVKQGRSVVFDFKTLGISVNNVVIARNGVIIDDKSFYATNLTLYFDKESETLEWDFYEKELNRMYQCYKHSIPSSNEPSRPYFKALKYDELNDDDKTIGSNRAEMRLELEYLVFMLAAGGRISELIGNGYFWRSKQDPDFVIMKSWFNL